MANKKYVYTWNNFRDWMSDDKYVALSSTFQSSYNLDTRTNPIWVQLNPVVKWILSSFDSPIVWMLNLADYWKTWILSYHENWKVYIDWVLKMDIWANTVDSNKKIYNAFYRNWPLSWQKIFFIWNNHIHTSNLEFTVFEYDKYDMWTNNDITSRPVYIQWDTARIWVANNLFKLTVDTLSNDVFSSEVVFDNNLKIVDITFSWQYYNVYVTEWLWRDWNWYIYKMDFKLPRPNFVIPLLKNPIRKAITVWTKDYIITWINENYSDLWLVDWWDVNLIKRWLERDSISKYKFSMDYHKSWVRKWMLYLVWKNNWDLWLFTYWSYFSQLSWIFKPNFVFDTTLFPSWYTWSIEAILLTSTALYYAYTVNWVYTIWYQELQYTPVNWYKLDWWILSNRFDAWAPYPMKAIEEIDIMYDLSSENWHNWTIEVYYSIDWWPQVLLATLNRNWDNVVKNKYTRLYPTSLPKTLFSEIEFFVKIFRSESTFETPLFRGIKMIYTLDYND